MTIETQLYPKENRKFLVLSDNEAMVRSIEDIMNNIAHELSATFEVGCSPDSSIIGIEVNNTPLRVVDVKSGLNEILEGGYSFVLSAHSKQIFPKELVEGITCINIHPGLNPYNRGMFPHVFSLVNGLPAGATLHVMDQEIDHGDIIDQQEVAMYSSDTSETLYSRVLDAEKLILKRNMGKLILGNYTHTKPSNEGNVNRMNDFKKLRELDLNARGTFKEHINLLRALSHGDRRNAFFVDPLTGKRVWVKIVLEDE